MKNKHIGLRLGMAFAVLIAVLMGIGQLGLRRMHEINDTLSGITGARSEELQLAREVLTLSNHNSRITMEVFVVQDRALTGMLLAERAENSKKISALVAKIASRCQSETEKQLLLAVEGTRKPYIDSYLRAIHLLVDEGEHDAAVAVMVNETLPALLKYHAAWDEFVEFQKIQLDVAAKQAGVDYAKARHLGSLLIVLAVVVAVAIALFATRETAREIAARIDAQNEVTKLNAALEEKVKQRTRDLNEANKHLNLQAAALEAAANAIVITDVHGTIMWVNPAFTTMTGYSREEVLGKNARLLKSGAQPEGYYAKLWATISSGNVWQGEIVNRRKDGTTYTEEMTITPVTHVVGNNLETQFIAIKQDITERRRAQDAMAESERRYRSLFDSNPLPTWLFARKSLKFLAVNEAAIRHYGFSRLEFLAMTIADIRPEADIPSLLEGTAKRIHGLQEATTCKHRKKDGTIIEVELVAHEMDFQGIDAELVAVHDVTERKDTERTTNLLVEALRQAEEKYRAIFEESVVGIFQVAADGRPLRVNRAFAEIHGYDSPEQLLAEVSNVAFQIFVDPKRVEELGHALDEVGAVRGAELEVQRRDGTRRFVRSNVRAVRDEGGNLVLREGTVEDITDRKVAEERVQFLAYYDVLTGLPNRALLQDRLAKGLAAARRQKNKLALLYLDLDRFKDINDSLGHSVGDLFLQEVAERLKTWAREQDTVARLGGDEFLIMLTHVKDASDAAVAAERLMDAMTAEFVVQGHPLNIGCSIGISIFPEHGADADHLIKNADAAMYGAKENGRNNFRFFTKEMNAQVLERLTLENSLRLALDRKELFLMYQPQIEIATGRITGIEALLRWQHPELGLVPPDKFIRIAENSGQIVAIGEWVLRTACSQSRRWQDEGLSAVTVAVNVSAVQFRQEGFCELVRRVLDETGLAPQCLELELTESLLLANADVTLSVIQELKAIGLSVAIDDFGTGYSSFNYLRQFRVSKLKIDRSFIRDVAVNPDDAAITSGIISMAKSLKLKVIAEGVENEAQMSFLRTHQCDEIQGYYFSKPLMVDKIADKLRGDIPEPHVSIPISGDLSKPGRVLGCRDAGGEIVGHRS